MLTKDILLILTSFEINLQSLAVNIALLIRELLLHRDKAVVPGFGTFTRHHRPAELSRIAGVLRPPSDEVVFDPAGKSDDGQLVALIARKHRLNQEKAREAVTAFVRDAEEQLGHTGAVDLEDFGRLGKKISGEYSFNPGKELLDRMQVFRLPELELRTTPGQSGSRPSPGPVPVVAGPAVSRRRWWIPAAVIVALAGLAALVYFSGLHRYFTTPDPVISIAAADTDQTDRLVFGGRDSAETDTLEAQINQEIERRTARQQALRYEEQTAEPKEDIQRQETVLAQSTEPPESASLKPYHIIAGSFKVSQNAERQRVMLEKKGLTPVMLPRRGNFYMVSLGAYDSHEQAVTVMKQLRVQLGQELWVMKI